MRHLLLATVCVAPFLLKAQDPERFEKAILEYEKTDRESKPPSGVNLFVGSSSIRRWADIQAHFPKHKILNRGFGGSQFSDLIYYADRLIFAYDPAAIFIYEGDNDLGAGEDPEAILKEAIQVREMIAEKMPQVPVVFISPKPSVRREHLNETYIAFNKTLKEYTEKTEKTEFVDVWNVAMDENGKVFRHIFVSDSLHMNEAGYQLWQQEIEPYLVNN